MDPCMDSSIFIVMVDAYQEAETVKIVTVDMQVCR